MSANDDPFAVESRPAEDDFDPFRTVARRQAGAGIAWLALLLVLGLVGFTGWQWWRDLNAASASDQAVLERWSQLSAELAASRQRLDDTLADQAALQDRLDRLEAAGRDSAVQAAGLEAVRADLASVQQRLQADESALAALAAREETADQHVELAEAAFLLRAANERLVLSGDRNGARDALRLADQRLAARDDPMYLPVRQSIAAALQSLEAMPVTDTVALGQRLDHLQARVPALALRGEAAPAAAPAADTPEPGLWAQIKSTLAGLVTVRRRVDDSPLFSLEDRDYLRQGLWLQLESARLALLRADEPGWQAALGRAASALDGFFDPADPQVRAALQDIEALAATSLATEPPDLAAPWQVLDRLRSAPPPVAPRPQAAPADTVPEPDTAG